MGSRKKVEIIRLKDVDKEPDDSVLQKLYMWVDEIPLSRPKRNLTRDFSDGVMTAELIRHFIPNHIDLHNYAAANSSNQKESNWFQLNKKGFVKLKFEITAEVIRALAQCRPWVAENFLTVLREHIDIYLAERQNYDIPLHPEDIEAVAFLDQPEVDQHHRGPGLHQRGHQLKKISPHLESTHDPAYNPSWQTEADIRGGKNVHVEMVPGQYLLEKEKESASRSQNIEMLNDKIKKLEHLLTLKDLRIEDLTTKVDGLSKLARGKQNRPPPSQLHTKKR